MNAPAKKSKPPPCLRSGGLVRSAARKSNPGAEAGAGRCASRMADARAAELKSTDQDQRHAANRAADAKTSRGVGGRSRAAPNRDHARRRGGCADRNAARVGRAGKARNEIHAIRMRFIVSPMFIMGESVAPGSLPPIAGEME